MKARLIRMTGAGLACISMLLAGCGEMKTRVWPFGGETAQDRPRGQADATEYQCTGGKRFFVRTLDGGAAVWLILPEREVRLDRPGSGAGQRYSNGSTVLEINGSDATLTEGAAASYAGCKTGSGQ